VPTPEPVDGLLVVDKPAGLTSHDVVARVRRLAGTRKVGHAGTLDPMATGVLVLGLGRGTRLLTYLVGADKTYEATIRLGATTVSDDADGATTSRTDVGALDAAAVEAALPALRGPLQQVPSAVSAIKVDGRRAYARVRAGEDVELAARSVTVHRFEVLAVRPSTVAGAADAAPGETAPTRALDVDVTVEVSSGTYVRALARDLGAALGVGGHLTALRRTRVGPYGIDVAVTLDDLAREVTLLPLAAAARAAFPHRELTETEAAHLASGRRVPAVGLDRPAAAFAPDGTLVAIVTEDGGDTARPVLVLHP